jgi:hypothetical protein
MRWAALALTVCGCNQIFDLDATRLVDAAPDVAADAKRTCPPIGTPLAFGGEFHQVVRQECQGYNFSSAMNIGVASCQESPTYGSFAYEGPRDQLMTKVEIGLTYIDSVRIYPEGDHVVVRGYDMTTGYVANSYARDAATGWTLTKDPLPPITNGIISGFSTGPDRRVLIAGYGIPTTEYAQDDTGAWAEVASYVPADWQCTNVNAVSLTSDGLRLFVSCSRSDNYRVETRYAERTSKSDMFGPLQNIEGAPVNLSFVVLDDDCSRAYFSALNGVFTADVFY